MHKIRVAIPQAAALEVVPVIPVEAGTQCSPEFLGPSPHRRQAKHASSLNPSFRRMPESRFFLDFLDPGFRRGDVILLRGRH